MKIALKQSKASAAAAITKGKRGPKKKAIAKKQANVTFSASDNIQTIDRDTVMVNGI